MQRPRLEVAANSTSIIVAGASAAIATGMNRIGKLAVAP